METKLDIYLSELKNALDVNQEYLNVSDSRLTKMVKNFFYFLNPRYYSEQKRFSNLIKKQQKLLEKYEILTIIALSISEIYVEALKMDRTRGDYQIRLLNLIQETNKRIK